MKEEKKSNIVGIWWPESKGVLGLKFSNFPISFYKMIFIFIVRSLELYNHPTDKLQRFCCKCGASCYMFIDILFQ